MNDRDRQKNLYYKVTDYRRFSFLFLFLAVFLYAGTWIPFQGKTEAKLEILSVASFILISLAALAYWRMAKAKKQLQQL
ncbi:YrhC family protein [Terrilactibacillus sp. S3-3]|nr:YrhC family protein [Terrilactibacillus sp. S3-3]